MMTLRMRGALATGALLTLGACGSDGPGDPGVTGLDGSFVADGSLTSDGSPVTDGSPNGEGGFDASPLGEGGLDSGLDSSFDSSAGDGAAAWDGDLPTYDGGIPDASTDASPIGPDGSSPPTVDPSLQGSFTPKSTQDGLRDGPKYDSQTLWYPETGAGPFPMVAVVPGWVSFEVQIGDWGPFLASNGFVVLTIGTNSPATDLPHDRAAALLDALETIKAENTRAGSPVQGRVNTSKSAVIGWSMGGGGALLAAEQDDSIDAVISLAGWNPGYGYGSVTQPVFLMAATADLLAGGQSQGFYSGIPNSVPKMLWESTHVTAFFGGHDTFNSPNTLDGEVGEYGLAWLKTYVVGDKTFESVLTTGAPASDHTAFCTNIDGADAKQGGPAATGCP